MEVVQPEPFFYEEDEALLRWSAVPQPWRFDARALQAELRDVFAPQPRGVVPRVTRVAPECTEAPPAEWEAPQLPLFVPSGCGREGTTQALSFPTARFGAKRVSLAPLCVQKHQPPSEIVFAEDTAAGFLSVRPAATAPAAGAVVSFAQREEQLVPYVEACCLEDNRRTRYLRSAQCKAVSLGAPRNLFDTTTATSQCLNFWSGELVFSDATFKCMPAPHFAQRPALRVMAKLQTTYVVRTKPVAAIELHLRPFWNTELMLAHREKLLRVDCSTQCLPTPVAEFTEEFTFEPRRSPDEPLLFMDPLPSLSSPVSTSPQLPPQTFPRWQEFFAEPGSQRRCPTVTGNQWHAPETAGLQRHTTTLGFTELLRRYEAARAALPPLGRFRKIGIDKPPLSQQAAESSPTRPTFVEREGPPPWVRRAPIDPGGDPLAKLRVFPRGSSLRATDALNSLLQVRMRVAGVPQTPAEELAQALRDAVGSTSSLDSDCEGYCPFELALLRDFGGRGCLRFQNTLLVLPPELPVHPLVALLLRSCTSLAPRACALWITAGEDQYAAALSHLRLLHLSVSLLARDGDHVPDDAAVCVATGAVAERALFADKRSFVRFCVALLEDGNDGWPLPHRSVAALLASAAPGCVTVAVTHAPPADLRALQQLLDDFHLTQIIGRATCDPDVQPSYRVLEKRTVSDASFNAIAAPLAGHVTPDAADDAAGPLAGVLRVLYRSGLSRARVALECVSTAVALKDKWWALFAEGLARAANEAEAGVREDHPKLSALLTLLQGLASPFRVLVVVESESLGIVLSRLKLAQPPVRHTVLEHASVVHLGDADRIQLMEDTMKADSTAVATEEAIRGVCGAVPWRALSHVVEYDTLDPRKDPGATILHCCMTRSLKLVQFRTPCPFVQPFDSAWLSDKTDWWWSVIGGWGLQDSRAAQSRVISADFLTHIPASIFPKPATPRAGDFQPAHTDSRKAFHAPQPTDEIPIVVNLSFAEEHPALVALFAESGHMHIVRRTLRTGCLPHLFCSATSCVTVCTLAELAALPSPLLAALRSSGATECAVIVVPAEQQQQEQERRQDHRQRQCDRYLIDPIITFCAAVGSSTSAYISLRLASSLKAAAPLILGCCERMIASGRPLPEVGLSQLLTPEETPQETFLVRLPGVNTFAAQLLLTAFSLGEILSLKPAVLVFLERHFTAAFAGKLRVAVAQRRAGFEQGLVPSGPCGATKQGLPQVVEQQSALRIGGAVFDDTAVGPRSSASGTACWRPAGFGRAPPHTPVPAPARPGLVPAPGHRGRAGTQNYPPRSNAPHWSTAWRGRGRSVQTVKRS
eukprot:TRINITY_DN705_c0_g2_i1.p1 TRINITY_DN705_c0_g2~~TRINITY_DN705_c0_g2_i1.p1  ORF type:complete len:1420 (+),score=240.75 TRINITY_DN705_c0_g2_i1:293-4261(+)